jgi:hypothetical protein
MKKILVVIFILSLVGVGCGTNSLTKIKFPEMCQKKELPKGFPKEYVMPDSLAKEAVSIGFSGEKASTGEEYAGKQDGFTSSFCAKSSKEGVISWYEKNLTTKGFKKLGIIDREYVFKKGSTTISVAAYDIAEGFVLYSFNIMTSNF